MKVLAAGRLLPEATPAELIRYTASLTDTVVIGCSTVEEVRENLSVARTFDPMPEDERRGLETRVAARAAQYDYFKG